MLSDERMMAIATEFNHDLWRMVNRYSADATRDAFLRAIRLAVAEAVEECAVVCDDIAEQYHLIFNDQDKTRVSGECAAAIRERAREKK